jgi:hypothetical protein
MSALSITVNTHTANGYGRVAGKKYNDGRELTARDGDDANIHNHFDFIFFSGGVVGGERCAGVSCVLLIPLP